eukprot:scaffold158_cov105-Cylindrotheca_fusiformis.AAC.4
MQPTIYKGFEVGSEIPSWSYYCTRFCYEENCNSVLKGIFQATESGWVEWVDAFSQSGPFSKDAFFTQHCIWGASNIVTPIMPTHRRCALITAYIQFTIIVSIAQLPSMGVFVGEGSLLVDITQVGGAVMGDRR